MIKEDYVSFETAKLLKENGFDGFCKRYYQTDKKDVNGEHALFMFASDLKSFCNVTNHLLNKYSDKNNETILAPTLQMAMKWIEEEGEHIIYTYPIYDGKFIEWKYNIWFDNSYMFMGQILEFGTDNVFQTREEACEAAIKYCLENLI